MTSRLWRNFLSSRGSYESVNSEDNQKSNEESQKSKCHSSHVARIVIACLLSALVGYMLGITTSSRNDSIAPFGYVLKTFTYNPDFAAAPSLESNELWKHDGLGNKNFMRGHSSLSNISSFSVFHQLHCIDMLRHGYYEALNLTDTESSMIHGHDHRSKIHLTHCFDYLRQTVQCAADTNVEPVDWDRSPVGITGWGFERVCRDFDAVKKYAESWSAF